MVGISLSGEVTEGVIPEPGGDSPTEITDHDIEALEVEKLRAEIAMCTASARLENERVNEIRSRIDASRAVRPVMMTAELRSTELDRGRIGYVSPLGAVGLSLAVAVLVNHQFLAGCIVFAGVLIGETLPDVVQILKRKA